MSEAIRYLYIPIEHVPFGAHRRALIVAAFAGDRTARYYVDCKYRPQMRADPDLRRLVKRGILVRRRDRGSAGQSNRTYLTLA